MSKPVLGRGLGELMQGQAVAGRATGADTAQEGSGQPSEGIQRLVTPRSDSLSAGAGAEARLVQMRQRFARLRPALFVGDFALCALAGWFAYSRSGTLGGLDVFLCGAAVLTGAALGILALTLEAGE